MRRILIALLACLPLSAAWGDATQVLAQADALHDQGAYADAVSLLLSRVGSASDGHEKAELYWRASRETLELGDEAEAAGKPQADILAIFTDGEGYADKAIAADPQDDLGYYWKSANIGRWGQVKGVLNSLFKAAPMRDLLVKELSLNPERSDAYYVLGQLYRELPGWPVSFGNLDAAVSLGRYAVDLRSRQVTQGQERELDYAFYTELAKTLYKRDWSAASRSSEQKAKASKLDSTRGNLERASLYEASVTLNDQSDRDEARALVRWVVTTLGGMPSLTAAQQKDLGKAKGVLKGW